MNVIWFASLDGFTLIPNTELKSSMIMWRSSICRLVFFTPFAEYNGGRFNGGDGINLSNCRLSNKLWHTSFIFDMDNCINFRVWYSERIYQITLMIIHEIDSLVICELNSISFWQMRWYRICVDDWFVTLTYQFTLLISKWIFGSDLDCIALDCNWNDRPNRWYTLNVIQHIRAKNRSNIKLCECESNGEITH